MNHTNATIKSILSLLVAGVLCSLMVCAQAAPPASSGFTLEDFLGRTWRNECVQFPLSAADSQSAKTGKALLSPDGKAVPYQLVPGASAKETKIAFMADLDPYQKRVYRFADQKNSAESDLKIEETADAIRLSNNKTGISIRKKLEGDAGPVESIRLISGKWVGSSRLKNEAPITNYTASIVARGPAFVEVYCRVEWGASQWHLRFRLEAGEPVVTVDETMALGEKSGMFSLSLSDNFQPDKVLFRYGQQVAAGSIGMNAVSDIKPGNVFVLEPWVRWWMQPNQGPVFSVYNDASTDLLSVGAGEAGVWVDPKMPADKRTPPQAAATQDAQGLHLDFALKNGRREWMISALDKEASLAVLKDPKLLYSPSLPHQYLIKHGQFSLDAVKDYVLDWKSEQEHYPHLLITKAQVKKYRAANAQAPAISEAEINRIVNIKPISQWSMHEPLSVYFATGNEKVGKYLAEQAETTMQEAVDTFLVQPFVPYGTAPHHQQILGTAPLVADAVLESKAVTPQLRKKLMAQIAFCNYAINRPEYWSEERGYSGNPNMTTSVLGYRVAMGSLIASHPKARQWVSGALDGLKSQLYVWSDSNGGWLEAPHYAMVSYDAILGSFLMAHNAGISELVYDPQMKKVINWFSKISTPKDFRFGGYRHLPPIGNTYISEPTGEFGIVASIWKEKDPQFASEMQWMHRQQKSWEYPGIGGGYPTMAGYRKILIDPTIPEKAPHWETEIFPNVNIILRNGFTSDRETHLNLLAGSFDGWRSHWDNDSGSFTLWGKGRILADDFGYYGMAPAADHNLMESASWGGGGDMKEFVKGADFDYVNIGQVTGQRQIAFVKDADPLAPNYYVVCDSQRIKSAATWRLWLTASKVSTQANGALVEGKEDVDMDVFFPQLAGIELKTEEKTRTSGSGIRPDGSIGATATTQIGLIASSPRMGVFTAVLFPRLKTEKPPVFTSLAEGKAVKVQSAAGTDYVFLSPTPFKFDEGDIHFEGTSGLVKMRRAKTIVALGSNGNISARGQKATHGDPNPTRVPIAPFHQAINGDFENGKQDVFLEPAADSPVSLAVHEGNPVAGDPNKTDGAKGKYSLAVTFSKDAGISMSSKLQFVVDPQRTYRLRLRLYAPVKMRADVGGYGYDAGGQRLNTAAGQIWQYNLELKGPTQGWQTFETTIGAPGSGAANIWPADILTTGLAIWPSSEKGTIYLDDISFEEVEPVKP